MANAMKLGLVLSATDKMSRVVDQATRKSTARLNKLERKMKSMSKISMVGGIFAIGSVLKVGTEAVIGYDKAMHSLSAITGVTGEGLKEFDSEIKKVSESTKTGYSDMAKAFELVGSAKPELLKSASALGEVSKQAIILGQVGSLLPEEAVGALTTALNQYGAGADQAAKYTNILATAQQKGSGTIGYLKEAIVNSGSTMKVVGATFEETTAILEGFAAAAIPPSQAGTSLASIMGRLSESADKRFNPQFTNTVDIIDNLSKANLSLTEVNKLVGREQGKRLLALVEQNKIIQELNGNLNEQGSAAKQAEEKMSSFSARLVQLKNKFENLMISGNESSGALKLFGGVLNIITNNLGLILAAVGSLVVYYGALKIATSSAAAVSNIYNIALGVSTALSKKSAFAIRGNVVATKAYAVVTKVAAINQWLLNSALGVGLLPLIAIAAGIAAVIAVVVICWKKFAGFRAVIKTVWETVKGFGGILKEYVVDRIKGIISGLGSMGRAIGLLFKGKFKAASSEALKGVKALSGYDAKVKAVAKSKSLVAGISSKHTEILKQERAAQKGNTKESGLALPAMQTQTTKSNSAVSTQSTAAINYSPVINIGSGSAEDKASFEKMLQGHKEQLSNMMTEINQDNKRLAY